jgi:hypothetical protein
MKKKLTYEQHLELGKKLHDLCMQFSDLETIIYGSINKTNDIVKRTIKTAKELMMLQSELEDDFYYNYQDKFKVTVYYPGSKNTFEEKAKMKKQSQSQKEKEEIFGLFNVPYLK